MTDTNIARQTILVVDDEVTNLTVLADLLKGDYEVLLAKSGEQALERTRQNAEIDLILLDVMMSGMNGYEVISRLKSNPETAGIAVIFITGLNLPLDEVVGLQAGGSDYITKPFNAAVVLARVALHLRMARHIRLLDSLANIDGLTEIANRRQFDLVLAAECRRAHRALTTISVAMLDVDFFKQYNDHYGHAAGDRALERIAGVLRSGTNRPGDLAARYGGEEFALVMPDTNAEGAVKIVDRIRANIENLSIPHEKSRAASCLTVSAGIACGTGKDMSSPEALLKTADERLYQAKAEGRNRVIGA